jgi:hypothetical protein
MGVLARVLIIVAVTVVVTALSYALVDEATEAAFRQWVVWAWRLLPEILTRSFASGLEPVAYWLIRVARRAATRQMGKVVWRVGMTVAVVYLVRYLSKSHGYAPSKRMVYVKLSEIEKRRYRALRRMTEPLKNVWNYKPGIPRWARASIAVLVGFITLLFCIEVSHIYGHTWIGWFGSLFFAVLVFWIVEKVPAIGADAVISIAAERWRRFKVWRRRFPILNKILGIHSGEFFAKLVVRKLNSKKKPDKDAT